jgi:hypothetical protein
VDQLDHLPSKPVSATDTATDPEAIAVDHLDQFLKISSPNDPNDPQMIHEVIQAPPLQGEGLRANDPTDPDFATSEKTKIKM